MSELKHIVFRLNDTLKDLKISAWELSDLWSKCDQTIINVIGDPILDRYIDVECEGQAKGYPVLKWRQIGERAYAGGCLKVAKDCAAQCARVHLGFCGGGGESAVQAIEALGEATNIALYGRGSPCCSLVEKIRYCYNNHQLFRVNIEHDSAGAYPNAMDDANVTILSLFHCLYPIGAKELKNLAGNSLLCIDSQNPFSIRQYRSDKTILFATEDEFLASGCDRSDFKVVFLKNGINGSEVLGANIQAFNHQPVDDIGAGDAYLASAAVVLGYDSSKYVEAAIIGSIASALHCAEYGNITITREMIDDVLAAAID